jgi:uncharacterized protein (TIGR01319 family)
VSNVLLIDFGSTYTKVTAVSLSKQFVLGTARAFTTVQTDIMEGFEMAMGQLESQIGRLAYEARLASSSAAGGLKMVTVGLVPELTAKAARLAALSAGAKVLKVFSFELDARQIQEIEGLKPEIILLTGGTDGGNYKTVLANARALAQLSQDIPIIYAGNDRVALQAKEILDKSKSTVILCPNVMPVFGKLQIHPVRQQIRDLFLQRIIFAKGLSRAASLVDQIIMPTPAAVLGAMELLSQGSKKQPGLGKLLCVDVGGATTDVYSILDGKPSDPQVYYQGLEEPYAKRTVEGDLGVRYSVHSLREAAGTENVAQWSGLTDPVVEELIRQVSERPELLNEDDPRLGQLDAALAKAAVKLAVERHAGTLRIEYTPMGTLKIQEGKDLSEVEFVIGTGGAIIGSDRPAEILSFALRGPHEPSLSLKPVKAKLCLDQDYIIAAMGLMAESYPDIALKIMKDRLVTIQ